MLTIPTVCYISLIVQIIFKGTGYQKRNEKIAYSDNKI
jgi:hypothetical protein